MRPMQVGNKYVWCLARENLGFLSASPPVSSDMGSGVLEVEFQLMVFFQSTHMGISLATFSSIFAPQTVTGVARVKVLGPKSQ